MFYLKYREGFMKNRYIGRTFIMAKQRKRKRSVKQKLNPIDIEFRDKNVLLVDDSIVRGHTSKQIIQMVKNCGARKVFFASASPPVRFQNVYGIDMPATKELIAHKRTVRQIKRKIGADELIYQELEDLTLAAHIGNPKIKKFEDSVFATWGWDGKNQIPIESSDGHDCGTIKLKLTPKDSFKDKLDIKKDVKKYLDTMKKEFPKIEKKLLKY